MNCYLQCNEIKTVIKVLVKNMLTNAYTTTPLLAAKMVSNGVSAKTPGAIPLNNRICATQYISHRRNHFPCLYNILWCARPTLS